MARTITISSSGGTLVMGAASGIRARLNVRGLGMSPVDLQTFESAADGARITGRRTLPRTIDMPIKITGVDRAQVEARFDLLSQVVTPDLADGSTKITVTLDGVGWFVYGERSGGGDPTYGEDTDGTTFVMLVLTFQCDPFWSREDQDSKIIVPGGLGRGLLRGVGSLSGLEVSSASALGVATFANTGSLPAFPTWRLTAPFTGFTLTSEAGEVLNWVGTKATGQIIIDTQFATIVDELGVNQYGGLSGAPRFWKIPRGSSDGSVVVADAIGGSTKIEVFWRPRKSVLF